MITTSEQLVEYALKEYESPLTGFAIGIVRDHDRGGYPQVLEVIDASPLS
jgi:hypothetical protein